MTEIWSRIQAELRRDVGDHDLRALARAAGRPRPSRATSCSSPPRARSAAGSPTASPTRSTGRRPRCSAPRRASSSPAARSPPHRRGAAAAGPARVAAPPPPGAVRDELNPKFTFEQFILGDGNRFAHAAALAVAELPAQAYNPLFLYGPPGVGKTHLLHSIGNYVRAYGGGATVRCTTAEAFTNAFLGALHGGDVDVFKERFRGVDVLLIDDVQFLESKARTEEEFFHTFNALHDSGSQVVLTSDRLPARPRRARGPPARALRVRPRRRHRPAGPAARA